MAGNDLRGISLQRAQMQKLKRKETAHIGKQISVERTVSSYRQV